MSVPSASLIPLGLVDSVDCRPSDLQKCWSVFQGEQGLLSWLSG